MTPAHYSNLDVILGGRAALAMLRDTAQYIMELPEAVSALDN
jgi:hypothetical protein